MLPNHAPLQVAEQFGTLESLFPGRIDLGLGSRARHRSCGGAWRYGGRSTRPRRVSARRARGDGATSRSPSPVNACAPSPAPGCECRSGFSGRARSARRWRRRWACRSRSPRTSRRLMMIEAIEHLSLPIQASSQLAHPYVMLGVNVVAADTDDRGPFPRVVRTTVVREPAAGASDPVAATVEGPGSATLRATPSDAGQATRVSSSVRHRPSPKACAGFVGPHARRRADRGVAHLRSRARLRSYEIAAAMMTEQTRSVHASPEGPRIDATRDGR